MLGNFIQSVRQGADTIILTGSGGPCRFGEYCELSMKLLRSLGYRDLKFIVLDFSSEIGLEEFMHRIGMLSKASPTGAAGQLKAWRTAYRVVDLCDRVDAAAYEKAGYEKTPGDCKAIRRACRARVAQSRNPEETLRLLRYYAKKLDAVPTDPDKNPLKVSILGEIFTVIDPFTNFYVEEKLMDYGVSSKRMLSPSWWVRDLLGKPLRLNSRPIHQAAKPYLPYGVGGHGTECVGEAVLAGRDGMDGAIQIFPLGCMPEIVAKAVLPAVSRDLDFPIMTLIVDEVAGEAGYLTRVEAFLDMLRSRRRQDALPGRAAFSGAPSPRQV